MNTPDGRPVRRTVLDRVFGWVESLRIGDRFLLKLLVLVFVVSGALTAAAWNQGHLLTIPREGGSLVEGVVGTPRFINPVLAVTNADKDMTALLYAGLARLGADGTLIPDMAESIEASEDGASYRVVLRSDITFHDGVPVTADDVLFTVAQVQDPAIKSPLLASWDGVVVEKVNSRELTFTLPRPYAPFAENLTLGILPKHIWDSANTEEFPFSQYNSEPIGSGPYQIRKIERDRSGIPESYQLVPHDGASQSEPIRIERLLVRFFPNEEALVEAIKLGEVDSAAGLSPRYASELALLSSHTLHTTPLPRTFTVFFNQNDTAVLRDATVRRALDLAVDRAAIVTEVLGGFGTPISGPIPPGFGLATLAPADGAHFADLDAARAALEEGGWRFDEARGLWTKTSGQSTEELRFSLATANSNTFKEVASLLAENWAALGVPVEVHSYEQSDLAQSIIRPRRFDALLFGTVVGRELDFYSFWHSSQRNDPGLNVASYANITTDALLLKARTTVAPEERRAAQDEFAAELVSETPAIFLFTPSFVYLLPDRIEGVSLAGLAEPAERFATIARWHTETESLWPFFAEPSVSGTPTNE